MRKLLMDHRCNELGGSLETFMLSGGEKIDIHGSRVIIYGPDELRPWAGEGLPPVGTVCELRFASDGGGWHEADIKFSSRNVVVWDWVGEPPINGLHTAYAHNVQFRPIRTAEQIATEEREKAIAEMVYGGCGCDQSDGTTTAFVICGLLYDAGYRKFEITDET